MATVNLTLRPPPNVDFVHGFPGIPPSQDRPQALVKGALELRVPAEGIKAKWVRIELRKYERIPPGGPDHEFWDYVGPSPVNLWTCPDEYGLLRSQDFPFSIRIPESIPPSVELDNRGQIYYELIATVCTKGKKGFLRKAKAVVTNAKAPITIDKHELHSTWPIYCQHEIRQLAQDGVVLVVERNHTCFGPGDRIAVAATIKSETVQPIIVTSMELALKETARLHPNLYAGVRRVQTQKSEKIVVKQAVDVNTTLYSGQQNGVELWCTLNPNHTTPTLTAARHMDINYACIVKANLSNGSAVIMELPVIISNWPRSASAQAVRQIGPTPNLSLLPVQANHTGQATPAAPFASQTLPSRNANPDPPINNFASATIGATGAPRIGGGLIDEFGAPGTPSRSGFNTSTGGPSVTPNINTAATTATPRQPRTSGTGGSRFTITNAPELGPIGGASVGGSSSAPVGGSGAARAAETKQWPSAEEEKRRYEQARMRVETVVGPHGAPAPLTVQTTPPPRATSSSSAAPTAAPSANVPNQAQRQWLSAEEEKIQLYNKAQQAAKKYQDPNAFVPPVADSAPGDSSTSGGSKPTGAQLYQQAMAAVSAKAGPPPGGAPKYLTAEQEKAALRRYEEAKRAVDVTQGAEASAPIAYEALFPNAAGGGSGQQQQQASSASSSPPPFVSGQPGAAAILSEKERLRREYEARDAAAMRVQNQAPPPFSPSPPSPPPPVGPPPTSQFVSAIAEKEAMRRKLEEKDRAAAAAQAQAQANAQRQQQQLGRNASAGPTTPVRTPPVTPLSPGGSRPTPAPPGQQRILTAAEEKALLKAKYDAQDSVGSGRGPPQTPPPRFTNGNAPNGMNGAGGPPGYAPQAPPPLMPRPPADYIKETKEEDDRVKRQLEDAP